MFVSLSTCDLSCSNQETRLSNLEAALQSHVLEAQGVAQTVTKSVSIQDDLLKAILTANEAFVRGRKTDPITVERDDMVRNNVSLTVRETRKERVS